MRYCCVLIEHVMNLLSNGLQKMTVNRVKRSPRLALNASQLTVLFLFLYKIRSRLIS